jgi:CheY-like chemotaxis protein
MAGFLLKDLADKKKAEREVSVIQDSSKHLLRLINDVLDMSRIESGKITFSKDAFDVNETADNVCEIIRPLYEAKRQKFHCEKKDILHPHILGDALRLNQILINLLNNAVKFTPDGGSIEFTVTELTTLKTGTVPFRFTVKDSGIGIPKAKLKTIFDPFSRVENETVVRTEGTGLGLAITKSYVEAQGGKITVQSEEGKGSMFTAELYYALDTGGEQRPEKKPEAEAERRFDGKTALLAEDNEINREIAETILTSYGFAVDSAGDGSSAVRRYCEKGVPGYDVIYMDIQMPGMNGYDAARAIRASKKADALTVPIIAMTANAFAEDVEHARSAGMNAHVAKPISPEELMKVTAELLQGRKETAGRDAGTKDSGNGK